MGLESFRKKQKGRKDPINVSVVISDINKAYREFFEINRKMQWLRDNPDGKVDRIFRLYK